jgi:hypothetical protein
MRTGLLGYLSSARACGQKNVQAAARIASRTKAVQRGLG